MPTGTLGVDFFCLSLRLPATMVGLRTAAELQPTQVPAATHCTAQAGSFRTTNTCVLMLAFHEALGLPVVL